MRAGDHGPAFKLRAPHTVESIREAVARAPENSSWRCRRGRHKRVVVGDVYIPEEPLVESALACIASVTTDALVQCRRCGAVAVRGRP